jgi:surface protein
MITSTSTNFMGVGKAAAVRNLVVNTALTVNNSVQMSQNVTVDELTTRELQVGTTASAAVLSVTGDTLTITQPTVEFNTPGAGTTTVRDALVLQQGLTVAAAFPEGVLTFTSGILTDFTPVLIPTALFRINTTNLGVSDSQSFALPLVATGTYDFTVAWGDGNSSVITAYNQPDVVHTYVTGGTYTLEITGTLTGWVFDGGGDRLKLLEISAWGDVVLGTTEGYYFRGCGNLEITAATGSPLRSATSNLAECFLDCTVLTAAASNIGAWDVSAVTDMTSAFAGCTNFNKNLAAWDTSSVETMSSMFVNCTVFNNGGFPLTWTTTALQLASLMFSGCGELNQTVSFSDMSNVTSMASMFQGCLVFNNGSPSNDGANPLTFTTTSALTDTSNMFSLCAAFNQTLVLSDVTGVVSTNSMFNNNSDFNNGSTTNDGTHPMTWTTTSALLDLNSMFRRCFAFNQTLVLSDASGVERTVSMFFFCTVFNNGSTVNDGGHPFTLTTTTALTNVNSMFNGCLAFNQPLVLSMSGVTIAGTMLNNCLLFKQNLSSWTISAVTNFTGFYSADMNSPDSATNQANYDALLLSWAAQVTNSGITLNMGTTKYSAAAVAARATLTATYGWTVNDGGLAP